MSADLQIRDREDPEGLSPKPPSGLNTERSELECTGQDSNLRITKKKTLNLPSLAA